MDGTGPPYVICVIENNHEDLLGHFIDHYKKLGVGRFVFGVRNGSTNPAWRYLKELGDPSVEAREMTVQPGCINGIVDSEFINKTKEESNDWYIPADLDEFHQPVSLTFQELKDICIRSKTFYASSRIRDMISADGSIPAKIDRKIPILEQFPLHLDLTEGVMGGCVDKVCLASKNLDVGPGHHYTIGDCGQREALAATYHFKWFGDLIDRERKKYDARLARRNPYTEESRRLLDHIYDCGGRLARV